MQDPERYDLTGEDFEAVYAFFPALLDSDGVAYLDGAEDFESEEVQNELFATIAHPELDEEERATMYMPHFFVADEIAMRSGMLRWVVPGQYGGAWAFDQRILTRAMERVLPVIVASSLKEWREGIKDGMFGDFEGWKKREEEKVRELKGSVEWMGLNESVEVGRGLSNGDKRW